jgi:hypothetical protein
MYAPKANRFIGQNSEHERNVRLHAFHGKVLQRGMWTVERSVTRGTAGDRGDRRDAGALPLSPHSRTASTGRLDGEPQAGVPALSRARPATTQQAPKRRVKAKLRSDRATAKAANDIWAMDFVHDQLFDDTKIRALTIVDVLSRVSPAIDVRLSYRGSMSSRRSTAATPSSATRGLQRMRTKTIRS